MKSKCSCRSSGGRDLKGGCSGAVGPRALLRRRQGSVFDATLVLAELVVLRERPLTPGAVLVPSQPGELSVGCRSGFQVLPERPLLAPALRKGGGLWSPEVSPLEA